MEWFYQNEQIEIQMLAAQDMNKKQHFKAEYLHLPPEACAWDAFLTALSTEPSSVLLTLANYAYAAHITHIMLTHITHPLSTTHDAVTPTPHHPQCPHLTGLLRLRDMTGYALDSSAHLPCVVCPGTAEGHPDTPIHHA